MIYDDFPLKIHFSLWNIKNLWTRTAALFQGTGICHSCYFILLSLESMLFINTSYITYVHERSFVHSPLIAYYICIENKWKWNNCLLKMTENVTVISPFYNNPYTKKDKFKIKNIIKMDGCGRLDWTHTHIVCKSIVSHGKRLSTLKWTVVPAFWTLLLSLQS